MAIKNYGGGMQEPEKTRMEGGVVNSIRLRLLDLGIAQELLFSPVIKETATNQVPRTIAESIVELIKDNDGSSVLDELAEEKILQSRDQLEIDLSTLNNAVEPYVDKAVGKAVKEGIGQDNADRMKITGRLAEKASFVLAKILSVTEDGGRVYQNIVTKQGLDDQLK